MTFQATFRIFLTKKWVFQKTHWEFLATGILWRSVCIAQEKGIQRQRCTDDSGHSKYLSGGTRQVHKRKKDNKLLRNPITSQLYTDGNGISCHRKPCCEFSDTRFLSSSSFASSLVAQYIRTFLTKSWIYITTTKNG